jgi:hypothetical protein
MSRPSLPSCCQGSAGARCNIAAAVKPQCEPTGVTGAGECAPSEEPGRVRVCLGNHRALWVGEWCQLTGVSCRIVTGQYRHRHPGPAVRVARADFSTGGYGGRGSGSPSEATDGAWRTTGLLQPWGEGAWR